jgi:phosphohistidine phosphatase
VLAVPAAVPRDLTSATVGAREPAPACLFAVKHLYLLRHAKSDWGQPLTDHDRPLAGRGRRASRLLEAYLRAEGIKPAFVLCSSALRTRETLAHLLPALGDGTTISIERGLYGAGASALLARLRRVDDAVPSVMVIGHNPGTEDLARELAGNGDRTALSRIEAKFPTAAMATIELSHSRWRDLAPRRARLTGFVAPRDLVGTYDPSP